MSTQVDRRVRQEWWTSAFETFPFTMFSGIQSFTLYQNLTDFIGGVVEFPIALIQLPYYAISGHPYTFPSRTSEMQSLVNLGRFRSFHSDVI